MVKQRFLGLLILLVGVFALFTACKQPASPSNSGNEQPDSAKSYTVTFNSNGGSAVRSVTVESDKTIARPKDPTKTDYDFAGWFRDNRTFKKEWNFATDKVTANITLYAKWEPAAGTTSYIVEFVTNCDTELPDENVVENGRIDEPYLTNPGNVLIGWFTTETFEDGTEWDFDTDTVIDNIILYAKWEAVTVGEGRIVVSFISNGGGSVPDKEVEKGAKLAEPGVSKLGYTLAGWYTTESFDENTEWDFENDTVGDEDFSLWAKWEAITYTVSFNSNGGSAVPSVTDLTYETIVPRPVNPVRANYDFAGWFRDEGTFADEWNFATDKVTANITLYAKWEPAAGTTSYTVKFVTNCDTTLADRNVVENDTLDKPDLTNPGNVLIGWFTTETFEDGTKWDFDTGTVTADFTLYAKWEAVGQSQIVVSFNSNGGGSVPNQVAEAGAKLQEPNVSRSGYTLTGWYTTEGFVEGTKWNFANDTISGGNFTLYARWEPVVTTNYTVTFNSNGGSGVGTITAASGAEITKPADPTKFSYNFAGWFRDNVTFANAWNFATDKVSADITLYAKWTDNPSMTSVFIDFSGYTGSSPSLNNSHQPPSPGQSGAFTLANGITGSGLRISNDGEGGQVSISQHGGGMAAQSAGGFTYFFIDNATVKGATTVTLEVTYYDNIAGNFGIQYRSAYGNETNDRFRGAGNMQKNGTGEYVTAWVTLQNCGFSSGEQQNQGAQFRLGSGGVIQKVKLIVGSLPSIVDTPPPNFAPQTDLNNIIGKGIAGYQSWFNAGSGHHWSRSGNRPGKNNVNVEMWPHTADYAANGATLYPTNFQPLGNGSPSVIFNSRDREVILTHFQWMEQYGIDCAAVQRFYGDWTQGQSSARNHLMEIRDAAEATGRSFYVMYDFSGWPNGNKTTAEIKSEWITNVEGKGVASSPNYAHAEGKPVAFLWGLGPGAENNWIPDAIAVELVNWFRDRGYFVIGGSVDNPNSWAGQSQGHRDAYATFDMLMPWPVGRYGGDYNSAKGWIDSNFAALQTFCNNNRRNWANNQPIKIMGGIYTGGGWVNLGNPGGPNSPPKNAGQPLWDQIRALLGGTYKPDTFYICMFDEYDESTAIMKAGSDYFDIPTDQWFLTLSTDGWWLSPDYYLRVAGAGIGIIKNPNATVPIDIDLPHSLGPLYYRNSFEKRDGWRNITNVSQAQQAQDVEIAGVRQRVPDLALDPCLKNPAAVAKGSGASLTTNAAIKAAGKSGLWVFHLAGNGNGSAYYKIGDVKINANATLQLKYSLKPLDNGGRNVFVDILFADGTLLSEQSGSGVIAQRGTVNTWGDVTITIPAKEITGVVVGYSGNGNFSAHVDDIIIQKP